MTHLNAADDGGGESRVVLRAQHDGVHQNEAATHNTGGTLLTLARQLGRTDFNSEISLTHLARLKHRAFSISLKTALDSKTNQLPSRCDKDRKHLLLATHR